MFDLNTSIRENVKKMAELHKDARGPGLPIRVWLGGSDRVL